MSFLARGRPQVDAAVDGVPVDLFDLVAGEGQVRERPDVLLELLDAARTDERGGDTRVAERPGERELRERLAPPLGNRVERTHAVEVLLGEHLPVQRARPARSRSLRD